MADEQRNEEQAEVEGHGAYPPKVGANDEPIDDDDEFEAHIKFPNVRMD